MNGFDTIIVVDWSARSAPSPAKPARDAIFIATSRGPDTEPEITYHRTRDAATTALITLLQAECAAGRRSLAGFDFPFGYPSGFARAVTGSDDPLILWQALADHIKDAPDNRNNRFAVATELNNLFPGLGPFWGCPPAHANPDLPARGSLRHGHGQAERREVERRLPRAQPCWKLFTTGSVGSQVLLGLPRLQQLRRHFGAALSVSPFQPPDTPIVLAEIYPSLLASQVKAARRENEILDAAQVRVLATALHRLPPAALAHMLTEGDAEEGWILGLGHEEVLDAGPDLIPPPLQNDCFALPPGVDWTPVPTALSRLRATLRPVVGQEIVPLARANTRRLATELHAKRANPPRPNSAVDGFGFAHAATGSGPQVLRLAQGRAAAGIPFKGTLPKGQALRILTGASLPDGVDTVVLEEDCTITDTAIAFHGPVKPGSNTRKAGEDVAEGQQLVPKSHRLRPPDLALLAATGHASIPVFQRLKVAVISTGDELREAGDRATADQIYDANRPMLAGLLQAWGHEVIDLGRLPDDPARIRAALTEGAQADAILTSGGASSGDEDHISKLLGSEGQLSSWRIALKPGRPLALAMWQGTPVFGLPGNPVAALVCTLIFARPALDLMAGGGWTDPLRLRLPAGFTKSKKPGRAEYLRARLTPDGQVETFKSEGSGRISGLSWAEGLVELPPEAMTITPGTPVTYLPYAGFGL
ncbi:molybdopterin molybdenumtransferase MoeA [Rhodophyticola sp. CCM32]|uniref:molybdopterin-binding protein n=1 Tax=Rhodophyticola sp. CCM32 TaxID=2916397 RepID=UPI00107F4FB7|nr:molybdopterin-binding protein [Rhodophyticola sp. CCM32]QBY02174.1 molybdopterin molybdenumtransferase MoeA [Rhodophyticola sp. CCM32]